MPTNMIALPPNFDLQQFADQIIQLSLPFVSISVVFLTYFSIKKICKRF